ncbi:MAG: alginate lyase family protein, partial [Gemmatimonadetes bacterium]|nr:alginate lyase family protein [Gemmatimonadota bacterium]
MPVTAAELSERRVAIGRTPVLARLRDRLLTFLTPLLQRPIYLPDQKALLSRDGGVCPDDGSRLAFDPFRPHRHHCSRCGRVLEGERHHRAWITRYQIWLSERAIHLALIGALDQDPALSRRAADILEAYAARYRDYPNRDNVLGPSRLFFSTYLESIWLCQVAIAASLLDAVPGIWQEPAVERVREMVAESAGLIGSFDEGWSNRQAWNNAALIAAGRWLDAGELVSAGLDGGHGMRAQLEQCVSGDGMWFEGENYHFFALRALLIAAEILRAGGVDLYNESPSGGALAALYVAPLKTVLPDLTLPARSDAPFGVSLLQPRFAELWEMGRVRTGQPAIEKILADLYASEPPAISHQP